MGAETDSVGFQRPAAFVHFETAFAFPNDDFQVLFGGPTCRAGQKRDDEKKKEPPEGGSNTDDRLPVHFAILPSWSGVISSAGMASPSPAMGWRKFTT